MGWLDLPDDAEPLSIIPDLLHEAPPLTLTEQLDGATISRLRYLADLGMYGGTQFLLELRDHRIVIVMAAPAPRDALGVPVVGDYAWYLAVHIMAPRVIVTRSIERGMREDRAALGEPPGDAVQRRVEGQDILGVRDSRYPAEPYASKGLQFALSGGLTLEVYAVPPARRPRRAADGRQLTPTAELVLDLRETDRLISLPGER